MTQADIDADKCPITDIKVLSTPQELDYLPFGYKKLRDPNSKVFFAYSKNTTDNLPLTDILMEQGNPCSNQSVETSKGFYFFEKMRFDKCPVDSETGLLIDERFKQADQGKFEFTTTEYQVQEMDGTLKILLSLPNYTHPWNVPDADVKKDVKLQPWIRPTLSWDLQCEGILSRKDSLKFYNISYFSLSHSFSGESPELGR